MADSAPELARLLSLVAHELRTPLSVTSGYVKMLASERPGPLTDDQRHALSGAGRACDMLTTLAADLSLLGRLEHGEVTPKPVAVDLPALAGEIARGYTSHPDHPVTVRIASTEPVTLQADPAHLRRTLQALLAAVVRAVPDHATVAVAWRTSDGPARPDQRGGADQGSRGTAQGDARGEGPREGPKEGPKEGRREGRREGRGEGRRERRSERRSESRSDAGADAAATATGRATATMAPSAVVIGIAEADRLEALLDADASALTFLDESQAGLGMVLPIARRLMTLAQGTILAASNSQTLGLRLTLPLRA